MKGAEVSITVQSGRTARHDDLQALREALQRAAPSQQQHLDLRSRLIDIVLEQRNYMELAAVHSLLSVCVTTRASSRAFYGQPQVILGVLQRARRGNLECGC